MITLPDQPVTLTKTYRLASYNVDLNPDGPSFDAVYVEQHKIGDEVLFEKRINHQVPWALLEGKLDPKPDGKDFVGNLQDIKAWLEKTADNSFLTEVLKGSGDIGGITSAEVAALATP